MSNTSQARSSTVADGYRIGTLRPEILISLGDPEKIWDGANQIFLTPGTDNDADAYFQYSSIGIIFRIEGNDVKEITLDNNEWICSNTLIVGMQISQALKILGTEYNLNDYVGRDYYAFDQFGILLEVNDVNGALDQINITENNSL